jgi:hypothetical protein
VTKEIENNSAKTLGAYFQAYKNKRATDFVLTKFRESYPDSPIMLISDGGDDFSDLASKHKTSYAHLHNIFGAEDVDRYYDSTRMIEAWRRHKLAVDNASCDYIMILEDDVLIQRQIDLRNFDSKGVVVENYLPQAAIQEIERCGGKVGIKQYGLCGGSVYSSRAFLNVYESALSYTREKHDDVYFRNPPEHPNRSVCAIDCNIVFHFNRCGYSYEKAEWLGEVCRNPDWKSFPVVHQFKEHY